MDESIFPAIDSISVGGKSASFFALAGVAFRFNLFSRYTRRGWPFFTLESLGFKLVVLDY